METRNLMLAAATALIMGGAAIDASPAFAQDPPPPPLQIPADQKAPPSARYDASDLEDQIEKKLEKDDRVGKYDVEVNVADGIAKLTGKVPTSALKTRAGMLAKIEGITRVDNQLEIDPQAPERTMANAGREAGEAVGTAGTVINDSWITTKIKTQFVGVDELEGSNIDVDTEKGHVTLNGTVASEAGRQRALQIAKATDGVKGVQDNLTIAPK